MISLLLMMTLSNSGCTTYDESKDIKVVSEACTTAVSTDVRYRLTPYRLYSGRVIYLWSIITTETE